MCAPLYTRVKPGCGKCETSVPYRESGQRPEIVIVKQTPAMVIVKTTRDLAKDFNISVYSRQIYNTIRHVETYDTLAL